MKLKGRGKKIMRKAGVLMPVSALPSRIGAGELGEAAFHFIELLKKNHVKIWQILPLNRLAMEILRISHILLCRR